MDLIATLFDLLLHLDRHLAMFLHDYGAWVYLLLFVIIFLETGLVVTPFLPGDSLLFVSGALAASGGLDPALLALLLAAAAIAGDTVNYRIGHYLGPKVFHDGRSRLLNHEHLQRTHRFFERYGGKTIIFARFVPIIRTFAPFVAGIGRMRYRRFLAYNVGGGIAWVALFVGGGYFFGNLPVVKGNLTLVIFGIILVSILPGVVGYLRHRRAAAGASEER